MTSKFLAAVAAVTLIGGSLATTAPALAQHHGEWRDGRGGGWHHDGDYHHGGYRGAEAGIVTGLAVGALLGNYAGHPYYCRHHHHWRWSPYYGRYVYYNGAYC